MIALYNQEKSPRSMKGVWSMEVGCGPGKLGSAFLLRLPSFFEVRAVAGNTYVLAAKIVLLERKEKCNTNSLTEPVAIFHSRYCAHCNACCRFLPLCAHISGRGLPKSSGSLSPRDLLHTYFKQAN